MVRAVNGIQVVPNRSLHPYLVREVPKKARAKSIKLIQIPDAVVESGDMTYVGRAVGEVTLPTPTSPIWDDDTIIFDSSRRDIERFITADALPDSAAVRVASFARLVAGPSAQRRVLNEQPRPNEIDARTGFMVFGRAVNRVVANPKMRAPVLRKGGGKIPFIVDDDIIILDDPSIITVDLGTEPDCSLAVLFEDGKGTVVAALDGYIGTIVVDSRGVVNVGYTPSRTNSRRNVDDDERARLDKQRDVIIFAAQLGVFRIEGTRDVRTRKAEQLANRIQTLTGIDPSIGLYAAYAYADADVVEDVPSVRSAMRGNLNVQLFDIAMLSGGLSGRTLGDIRGIVPFCPMLSRGWGLLRAYDVRLSPEVEMARHHLIDAFWTTFDQKGMDDVIDALQNGRLL
jgi:hypothetical protein